MITDTKLDAETQLTARKVLRQRLDWRCHLVDPTSLQSRLRIGRHQRFTVELSESEAEPIAQLFAIQPSANLVLHNVRRESEVADNGHAPTQKLDWSELVEVRIDSVVAGHDCNVRICGALLIWAEYQRKPIPEADGGPQSLPPRNVPEARRSTSMTITYDPEAATITWPDNIYGAHIESAVEKRSKARNRMIEFTFICFHRELGKLRVWDHIVIPKQLWKLKLLAQAIGADDAFESGEFDAEDYVGAHLELELHTEEKGNFPPRNVIVEYLPAPLQVGPSLAAEPTQDELDEAA